MVGGFFTGWATSSSQWVVDVTGESEGQNFWCYALEEEWKMGNCMKFRLSLWKEFGNCMNNIRQEGRVFKFMYWGMWMVDSLEVLCFNFFFFSVKEKKWSAELGQGRGCWGLKSEKMSNTCLGAYKCEWTGDIFNDIINGPLVSYEQQCKVRLVSMMRNFSLASFNSTDAGTEE